MIVDPANLRATSWYRQAAAAKLIHIMYPFRACLDLTVRGQQIPNYYDQMVTWLSARNEFYVYFGTECLERVARFYVNDVLVHGRQAATFYTEWRAAHSRPLIDRWANQSRSTELAPLLADFQAFSTAYRQAWNEAIFLDSFDSVGERLIREIAGDQAPAAIQSVRHPFTSIYQEERRALLSIAETVLADGQGQIVRTAESVAEVPDTVRLALKTHADRFHWIQNDYATVRRLDAGEFLHRMKTILFDESHLKSERLLADAPTVAHSEPVFDEPTNRAIAVVSLVAAWRDERKAMQQQAVAITQSFLEAIGQLTGASVGEMEWLEWNELELWLNGDQHIADRLTRRKTGVLHSAEGRELIERYDEAGQQLQRALDQQVGGGSLKGRVAYAGHVVGTARLIFDQRDFPKFQAGDILVAPNTRPEYLPIMRLAKAVVTEEGGLTSHAAIVARELSVPTIVGVQGVITTINDGDEIEVDANEGVVRKLS